MARTIRPKREKKVKSITSPVNDGNRLIIVAAVAIVLVFLLAVIGMGLLFTNVLGRFAQDDTSTGQVTTITYSIKTRGNYGSGSAGSAYTNSNAYSYDLYGDEGADMNGETTLPKVTSKYGTGSEFQYGTIKGSKYHSDFSGMTFDAPSGWTLTGASKSSVTPTSVLDLDARNSTGSMSVKLQYFSLSGGSYTSTSQVLSALKAQVSSDTEMESKSKTIAGNNFKGFAFDGLSGQDTARSEVMVAQVNGYALVLQVVAPTQKDIDNILKNFS